MPPEVLRCPKGFCALQHSLGPNHTDQSRPSAPPRKMPSATRALHSTSGTFPMPLDERDVAVRPLPQRRRGAPSWRRDLGNADRASAAVANVVFLRTRLKK